MFQGVFRWLNNGVHLCVNVSVGQWKRWPIVCPAVSPLDHSRFFLLHSTFARLYNAAASPTSRLHSAGSLANISCTPCVPMLLICYELKISFHRHTFALIFFCASLLRTQFTWHLKHREFEMYTISSSGPCYNFILSLGDPYFCFDRSHSLPFCSLCIGIKCSFMGRALWQRWQHLDYQSKGAT